MCLWLHLYIHPSISLSMIAYFEQRYSELLASWIYSKKNNRGLKNKFPQRIRSRKKLLSDFRVLRVKVNPSILTNNIKTLLNQSFLTSCFIKHLPNSVSSELVDGVISVDIISSSIRENNVNVIYYKLIKLLTIFQSECLFLEQDTDASKVLAGHTQKCISSLTFHLSWSHSTRKC